ncbi:glycosyltransferase family 32 protein [Muriicola soli]|uniref:Glycosyl transferase n=1 Tax=Muriicola soli TaxID=2507538 RepID=A0A411E8N5_9FLAO|nr:glycosyltransferase [Muriicola soli]QBA63893.1 glycosyl transferase [Muriicola soli]
MIPKKIHYCWLSGDPYPPMISKCMESWKTHLPNYELVLWDLNRFDLQKSTWVKQAFEQKKYAFAADYIRLYALYHHGGIYLDTDVEVRKSFDPLLHLPYFFGTEGEGMIEAAVIGAEKGTTWLAQCLDHYRERHFIKENGDLDIQTLPRVMGKQINKKYGLSELNKVDLTSLNYEVNDQDLFMFPKDYFCAKDHGTGIVSPTDNTFSIHHFAMSWVSNKKTFLPNVKRKLISLFGKNLIESLIKNLRLRNLKNRFN